MSAPPVIADLVERFEQQGDVYKSGQYNEAQLHSVRDGGRELTRFSIAGSVP